MKRTKCILAAVVAGTLGMASSGSMAATYYNADVTVNTINANYNINTLDTGNFTLSITNLNRASHDVELHVLNGATLLSSGNLAMGYTTGTDANGLLLVSGIGSAITISNTGTNDIGASYVNHVMRVENKASALLNGGVRIGRNAGGDNCQMLVSDALVTMDPTTAIQALTIGGNAGSTGNNLTVTADGLLVAGNATYRVNLAVGTGTTSEGNNTLTLADGGMLQLVNSASTITAGSNLGVINNYIQFDGGYFAWNGDKTASLNNSMVRVWDGAGYVAGVLGTNYTATYYADAAAAQAATGFAGLGGYTVFTNAVPEPASLLLTGSALGLLAMRRRREH